MEKQEFAAPVGSVSGRDTITYNEIQNINLVSITLILNDQTPPELHDLIQYALTNYKNNPTQT